MHSCLQELTLVVQRIDNRATGKLALGVRLGWHAAVGRTGAEGNGTAHAPVEQTSKVAELVQTVWCR